MAQQFCCLKILSLRLIAKIVKMLDIGVDHDMFIPFSNVILLLAMINGRLSNHSTLGKQRLTSILQAFAVQNLLNCTFPGLAARPATMIDTARKDSSLTLSAHLYRQQALVSEHYQSS